MKRVHERNEEIKALRKLFELDSSLQEKVDPRNRLNELPGKIWIQETKTVWRQKGLGSEHNHTKYEKLHPAPFSFQDVGRLVRFFTKAGGRVLDPFVGVGSTLKACAFLGREGTGVELSRKWYDLALKRLEEETDCPETQRLIHGDIRDALGSLTDESFDFVATSPPYWSILNKRKDYKARARITKGLDHNYSSAEAGDLGHIPTYEEFVRELSRILHLCAQKLKPGKYMAVIVSDFKHGDRFYPFHSDLYSALEGPDVKLQGVTILEQTHKTLLPYGYPFSYVPNVHHQYILILQRADRAKPLVKRTRAFRSLERNRIYCGDALDLIKKVPDCSVNLVIADPPYNIRKDFESGRIWDGDREWVDWCKSWLLECQRVLRDDGSIFVYGIHNYLAYLHTYLMDIGMAYRRQFIWYYENNFSGFTKLPSAFYEPLLWFSKGEQFTYHPIREPYKSTERLKHKITKNGKVWTPNPEGRHAGDVWYFPVLAGKRFAAERVDHPTQKPLNLTHRIVRHFSNKGEVVLVPFAGSGTECVSCLMNERTFIGFELTPKYVKLAEERLRAAARDAFRDLADQDSVASPAVPDLFQA